MNNLGWLKVLVMFILVFALQMTVAEWLGFFDISPDRAFFTLEAIDGELVPAVSMKLAQAPGIDDKHAQAGVGINVAMDRGFFWLGLDFIWNQLKSHDWVYDKTVDDGAWVYDSRNEDDPHWDKRSQHART